MILSFSLGIKKNDHLISQRIDVLCFDLLWSGSAARQKAVVLFVGH